MSLSAMPLLPSENAAEPVVGTPLLSGLVYTTKPKTAVSQNGVTYQILGDEAQSVEVMLRPGQVMRMEPGKMVHMHASLMPEIGTDGGFGQACMRACCAGGSLFRLMFENKTSKDVPMAASPSWPAKVVPFDMSNYNGLHLSASAWFASVATTTEFSIKRADTIGAACCGGQGLFYNVMTGDGVAFLCGGGAIVEKSLAPGEVYVIDTSSLLAWEPSVNLSVRRAGGLLMCCCGGEGLFLNEMTGPGRLWIQPMPLKKLKAAVAMPGGGGDGGGGG